MLGAGAWAQTTSAHAWDPGTNSWSAITYMINGYYGIAGGAVAGRFYVVGGANWATLAGRTDNQQYRNNPCTPTPVPPTSTFTHTSTPTRTPTLTGTPTITRTPTSTFTRTPTSTPSPTRTGTPTSTLTHTPTTTQTHTPTSTTTPGLVLPTIVGHVVWEGRGSQPSTLQILPISLTLRSTVGSHYYDSPIQLTDGNGYFTMTLEAVPAGTYTFRVKGSKFLAKSGVVTLTSGINNLELGLMTTGDLTGDNLVDIADFSTFKPNFGTGGAPPMNPQRDRKGDGQGK